MGIFKFGWVHRPRKQNLVVDALSRKVMVEYVATIITVETNFLECVPTYAVNDVSYTKIKQKIGDGLVRRYWVEDDLIYARGGRVYVPT